MLETDAQTDFVEIRFPAGLPGFPTRTVPTRAVGPAGQPVPAASAVDDPDVGFVVVPPWVFYPDYEFDLDDATAERLGLVGRRRRDRARRRHAARPSRGCDAQPARTDRREPAHARSRAGRVADDELQRRARRSPSRAEPAHARACIAVSPDRERAVARNRDREPPYAPVRPPRRPHGGRTPCSCSHDVRTRAS